jgi:hypothetical protein
MAGKRRNEPFACHGSNGSNRPFPDIRPSEVVTNLARPAERVDGGGRGVAADVRRNPDANCAAAGAAGASMRAPGQITQATTGEVRLDPGKAARFSASRERPERWPSPPEARLSPG